MRNRHQRRAAAAAFKPIPKKSVLPEHNYACAHLRNDAANEVALFAFVVNTDAPADVPSKAMRLCPSCTLRASDALDALAKECQRDPLDQGMLS